MKFKKLFICLFSFSLFLTSCSPTPKDKSNVENKEEVKNKEEAEKETVDKISFEKEIKKVELPQKISDLRFLNYNPENNKLYFNYTIENKLVYASKNLKDGTIDIIYEIKGKEKENMFDIAIDGIIDEKLFIVKVNHKNIENKEKDNEETLFEYNFIVVDKNKNIQKYFNEDEDSMSGDNQTYAIIPSVSVDGHNLILTCENMINKDILKSYLLKFNIDDGQLTLLKEEELSIKNDKYNGKYIMFAGSFENNLYYQVVTYNNEDSLAEGSSDIFKYISIEESKKILELNKINAPTEVKNRKAAFVSGDNKLLFISEFLMVESTYNTGKVFNLETMSSTEIPNIESPYDITDIYRIKDLYILNNNRSIYAYNSDAKLLLQINYQYKEKIISKMAVTNDIISYLFSDNFESKEAELHIIKLKRN